MASAIDLAALNSYLMDKSYVNDEFEPTQADVILWSALQNRSKEIDSFPFTARWFSHIASFDANEKKAFATSKDDLNAIVATVSSRLYFILRYCFTCTILVKNIVSVKQLSYLLLLFFAISLIFFKQCFVLAF